MFVSGVWTLCGRSNFLVRSDGLCLPVRARSLHEHVYWAGGTSSCCRRTPIRSARRQSARASSRLGSRSTAADLCMKMLLRRTLSHNLWPHVCLLRTGLLEHKSILNLLMRSACDAARKSLPLKHAQLQLVWKTRFCGQGHRRIR